MTIPALVELRPMMAAEAAAMEKRFAAHARKEVVLRRSHEGNMREKIERAEAEYESAVDDFIEAQDQLSTAMRLHLPALLEIAEKAQAVVERWDTPLWKDVPHTAGYIEDLRGAIAGAGRGA